MLSEDQGSQNFVLQKPQEATNHRWELVMKLQNKSSFKNPYQEGVGQADTRGAGGQ